jgi:hypothetical protein
MLQQLEEAWALNGLAGTDEGSLVGLPGLDEMAAKGNVHGAVVVVEQAPECVIPGDGVPGTLYHGAHNAVSQLLDKEHISGKGEVVHRVPLERAERFGGLDNVVVFNHLGGLEEEAVALNLHERKRVGVVHADEEVDNTHLAESLAGHGKSEEVKRNLGVALAEICAFDVGTEPIKRVRRPILASKFDSCSRAGTGT